METLLSEQRQRNIEENILNNTSWLIGQMNDMFNACMKDVSSQLEDIGTVALLGLKPYKDGNQWCVLWGENIQEGICGFGDTPMKAIIDFTHNLKNEKA